MDGGATDGAGTINTAESMVQNSVRPLMGNITKAGELMSAQSCFSRRV